MKSIYAKDRALAYLIHERVYQILNRHHYLPKNKMKIFRKKGQLRLEMRIKDHLYTKLLSQAIKLRGNN